MGVVYKAWDTKLERHVALKFLSPRLLSRPADVARFKREAQIARGLARTHRKGIVHRDVKPANVRVTPEDEVKVVDFGLARATDRTRLTQSGMSVGTVAYMSPEQVLGNEIDARSDRTQLARHGVKEQAADELQRH